jgi:hypothetical protein
MSLSIATRGVICNNAGVGAGGGGISESALYIEKERIKPKVLVSRVRYDKDKIKKVEVTAIEEV